MCQVENKVKARQQADKIAQKKANKIKQKIENNEKEPAKKKENKKSRGALQREKKRARKEAGNDNDDGDSKKPKLEEKDVVKPKRVESGPKLTKPPKKRKVDSKEDALEDMIRSYKASFSGKSGTDVDENKSKKTNKMSRESVAKKRWFE